MSLNRPSTHFKTPRTVITLALSKGRIFDETLPLLEAAGIRVTDDPETSRQLILATSRSDLRIIIVRASDVPTYVLYGAAPRHQMTPTPYARALHQEQK